MENSGPSLSKGIFSHLGGNWDYRIPYPYDHIFVYGVDKRTVTASLGSLLGILATCILGMLFTDLFHINGAVMPDSESLLYSGFQHLDLTAIFMSSIFIGASGAMMDLSVDITSAIYEVVEKKPDISWKEAAKSGMNVGAQPWEL